MCACMNVWTLKEEKWSGKPGDHWKIRKIRAREQQEITHTGCLMTDEREVKAGLNLVHKKQKTSVANIQIHGTWRSSSVVTEAESIKRELM